jgi:O-antigen/teichoic acid export membrane protein
MARAAAADHGPEIKTLLLRVAALSSLVAFAFAAAFWLFGEYLMRALLGDAFTYVLPLLSLYLAGSILAAVGIGLQPAALAVGLQAFSLRVLTVCVGGYLAALPLLIISQGLEGAAWAYIGFYLVWNVFMWRGVLARLSRNGALD